MSAVMATACSSGQGAARQKGKFVNSETRYALSLSTFWEIAKVKFTLERKAAEPNGEIPVAPLSPALLQQQGDAIYRLGHSTMLIRLNGEYILIDPVFSERASPLQWVGPKRFHPSPISIEQLPQIKLVIISHDHYDHLDKTAIKRLADKVEYFVTPLKVGDYLIDWGIEASRVTQLDWWQEMQMGDLTIAATPAQHFSGRGLLDRNQTLWAGWVIINPMTRLYFSGDSGYFSGFKEIGQRYGPFDITMIETGAYNALWADIHMLPEQSIQAHIDVQGKAMMPIHNGTFDLAMHEWYEPLERASTLAQEKGVDLLTPGFGQPVSLSAPQANHAWWRDVEPGELSDWLAMEQ